jgi:preprotein translocase subunit SecE
MQEIETELKITRLERLKNFFYGLKQEIQQISWPTQKELKKYTRLVILSTLTCGFCVYIVDLASKYFLDGLRNLVKLFLT